MAGENEKKTQETHGEIEEWSGPKGPPVQPTNPTASGFFLTPHCLVYEFTGQIAQLNRGHWGVNLILSIVRGADLSRNRCRGDFWPGFMPGKRALVEIHTSIPGTWYSWRGSSVVGPWQGQTGRFELTGGDFRAQWHFYPSAQGQIRFAASFSSNGEPAPFGPFEAYLSF
jgi:hypothetical protein